MPELPEVQTTVDGLNKTVKNRIIVDVWTDYMSSYVMHAESIKNPQFFKAFKKKVTGQKIIKAERRAKNILIHLSSRQPSRQADKNTILIHMKMTGHMMYGSYVFNKKEKQWKPTTKGPLEDPLNQFIHLVFILDNGKHLVFSDMRKFAKVTLIETEQIKDSLHLTHLGPEPLDRDFSFKIFKERVLTRPRGKIKQVLMDQSIIVGIGNIYSDEILWRSNVHPLSLVEKIPDQEKNLMYKAIKQTLLKGLKLGGDSTSDYRNIYGEHGEFQATHNAYQMHKKKCRKPRCPGVLERIMVGGRSAHFCPVHQKFYN
jgi:formamidopyrimidine-DNA glycosylase